MSGWLFAHPAALSGLLLVPLLWWRARAGAPPRVQWTAALALWRRALPVEATEGATRRSAISWSLAAALCAVTFAVLALADPQRTPSRAMAERWTLVLDRSPSMFLPVPEAAGDVTRLQRAVELAVTLCERFRIAPEARSWTTYAFDGAHATDGARPPAAWLTRAWGPGASTPWLALDAPGHVFVTDCAPELPPARAGLVHSGAAPVHGPVADQGERCLEWDGVQLQARAWTTPRPGLHLGARLPEDLALLARLWSEQRGLDLVGDADRACLRIEPVARSGSPERTGRLEGPGWSVDARSPQIEPEAGFTSFASFRAGDGERFPAVQWRPGSIHVAPSLISAEQADSAVFSVSWAELFDRARLPDPEVV
ncbi:MAG TPA: hypothetical protein VM509_06630, partial [Planctomycetota bacterium]|nr:hypothetical protein [Planctomycetota bacterium]